MMNLENLSYVVALTLLLICCYLSSDSLPDLSKAAQGNRKLHGAYRREVQKEVKTRLEKDSDYRPDRFPQTRDYFDKDTQRN